MMSLLGLQLSWPERVGLAVVIAITVYVILVLRAERDR